MPMRYLSTISLAILVLVGVTALAIMIGGQRRDERLRRLAVGRWLSADAAPGSQWTIEFVDGGVYYFNIEISHEAFVWNIHRGRLILGSTTMTIRELNKHHFIYADDHHPVILIRVP